jgi:hypothetical protein
MHEKDDYPIHQVKSNAGRQSMRQPETALSWMGPNGFVLTGSRSSTAWPMRRADGTVRLIDGFND